MTPFEWQVLKGKETRTMKALRLALLLLLVGAIPALAGNDDVAALKAKITELQAQVDAFEAERALVGRNIGLYDKMDLDAFSFLSYG